VLCTAGSKVPRAAKYVPVAGKNELLAGGMWYGVDIKNETVADNMEAFVWEPALVKINYLQAATEAACLILSVDETVRNPKAQQQDEPVPTRGRGRGRVPGRM